MSLLKTAFAALSNVQREQLLEAHLRDRVARVLGISVVEVDAQRPLGSLGLDSLKAVELQHGLERDLSITLPMADVLSARHVADLVSGVLEKMIGAPSSSTTQPDAPPAPAADTSRLSRGQEALWFLQQLSPDSAAYNIAYAMRVRSLVDPSRLRRTLQVLVDRHACLRTRFENRNGRPWADVRERDEVSFTEVDAASWSDGRLQQYLTEQSHRPFDLERGPLFNVHLLTRSARDHVLLICVHHISVDFWSLVVLTDELARLYEAEDPQAEERRLPSPAPYAEFVRWQDGMLGSDLGREHETYWLKQLSGTLPVLNLPTDRPRPPLQTHRGASHTFRLGPELTRALHDLARQQQVTLYSLLLATFQSLLHRYTGDAEVLIGSPVAGRSREGFGGIVGYFVNMVALRSDLSDDPTFTELLSRTRATVLGALAHQDFPFALLVDRLEQNRDPSRSPVFQAAFVLEKPHILEELAEFVLGESGATMSLGGLQLESLAIEQRVSQFDLTLMMVEAGGGLAASIQYNADLFDPSTISRLARHYRTLVEGVAAGPHQRLSELPLLSVDEHRQLLAWKGEVDDVSPAVTLQELFEAQVARTPDAVSVAWDGGQLSYHELNRRANQLAHHLRRRGVGPEILVGVSMDRSPEMIVAILGILKAGGGYFPLDPGYPPERLSFMLRDGDVRLVLGKDQLAEASDESGENLVPLSTEQNLAYVMYTSGSTGTPNGVAVCQQSVIRLVSDPNYVTLTASDVILQLAPNTFDAATFEIWASLLHGGRLVLATDDKPSLEQVSQLLTKHHVTTLWLTSGLFHQLVDHDVDAFGTVRQLLAGGDVLSVSHVRNVLTRHPSCRVINGYGPTENTTFTCCYPMQGDTAAPAVSVPIGRPITGTEVFVVDRHQHAVPIGVSGELLTGGTGLARGYLGRPSFTAERFVPSTLSEHGGARLYKTGDLVRYLESGAIEFLGRLDFQLKIRGFRVELGEIETALTSHPMVRACVVVAQAGPTAKRLIAYLVADSDRIPSTSQLREYLSQRLPDYMVPAVFVTLDAFPLTANGKVDRRALPAPDQSRPELDNQFEAPRPGSEARLAAIWSELLGVDRIGRHDNFFELGGHSLIGTQVVSRIRDIAGVDMPLRHLFERPTVAGLAQWLDGAAAHQQERRDPALVPVAGAEPPVMSFAQERLWLLEQLILGTPVYNIPAVIRLRGALNVTALGQAIDEIRRRHEVLRTNFRTVEGQPVPAVSPASSRTVPIADVSDLSPDANAAAVRLLIRAEALRPFDLAADALIRISLVRLGASEHVILATMHHIVSDGWSIGILMRELASLYRAFCSGERSGLAEPAIQYRDFAHWQKRWQQGPALDEQLSYWTNVLSGARTSIELPIDHERTSPPSYRGSTESRVLQPELVTDLHAFGTERGLTPFMVVLAALNILLARMSRQSDLVVGTVISGRTRTEIEPLIGCFMNFLPLRTTVAGDASGETVLQQVRTTVLDADAHQDCPFQKIVEAVRSERGSSQNPLYNVSFQFENYPQRDSFADTLEASFEPPHREISLLDLRFVASDTPSGTVLSCEYASDLFEAETIRALLESLCTVLEKLVHEPETRFQEFPVLETLVRRAEPETVAIAATFTAEPVEESIAFWTDHLEVPCNTQFAPYSQVFQQLLAPDSLLAANRRGVNVLLVRLEDWQRTQIRLLPRVDPDERERILASQARTTLPNRLEIAHLNQYETDYLYQEIFVDQVYLKHGIELHDGACVFDIGANIGMFTLFVRQRLQNATIHAFEPAPHTFEVLQSNVKLYGHDVQLHHCGVADQDTEATFTFYPRSSVFSSFHANADEDTQAIRAVVLNSLEKTGDVSGTSADSFADELMSRRLERQEVVTRLRSISSVVKEHDIHRIDLLKVDAEKSELGVLRGIDDDVWGIIRQIVIEVHDQEGPVMAEVMRLLGDHGFEATVEEEDALRGSGLYNVYAVRASRVVEPRSDAHAGEDDAELQRKVEELGRALTTAAERTATPWLLCLCPSSPARLMDPVQQALHARMEGLLASSLNDVNGVTVLGTRDLARLYPVSDYYDRHGDELGHVPYTRGFFAALGTSIVRHIAATKRSPYKVIVLDCDQTLWRGVVGEDGVEGIAIGAAQKALQEFMVAQHHGGKLICLCSKNQESDVLEVFDRRDDMPLRREHLVSWRINWQAKSQNIRSLATELQLGLDSFVFLDDSPLECAEVQANCPEVLSLQIPKAAEQMPAFLRSVWAFDQARTTSEDRQRTRLYQQNARRERLRETSLTFAEFIADLDLQVSIEPMSPQQLPRVSQLTQRTNQFNVHKLGRSEGELDALSREANTHCLTVRVSDRFGDYGLVGVAICEADTGQLNVDTLLLSCRALGRGVEHRVLARLGEIAADRGLAHVRVPLKPTDRNQPALEFLTSVGARYGQPNGDGIDFVIPTQEVQAVTFQPGTAAETTPEETTPERAATAARSGWSATRLSEMSARLLDVPEIIRAIDDRRMRRVRSGVRAEFVAPRNETERLIVGIWEQLLGLDRVGINENFFELGGHSLLATQVISRLCDIFRVNLRLQDAFDAPTVAGLAQIVERAREADTGPLMPPVQRVDKRGELPLSFAQERLWFLDQLEPGSDAYNIPAAIRMLGSLSIAALEQVIEGITGRHEVLRTTFSTSVPPVQQILPASRFSVRVVDLTCLPDRENVCRKLVVEEAKRPFDLARGPLLRMTVVRLSGREHVLLFTMHHIVGDGWSIGILIDELSKGYGTCSTGIPARLSDLPIQYADFAVWQRNWLSGGVLADQIEYWKSQLSGSPPSLDLPTDRPRPAAQTYRGAQQYIRIAAPITQSLKALSRREGTTLFMVLLTAFQSLLNRWTDQIDILVGVPIAGRKRAETQDLIGFFVNTLVMRGRVRPEAPFRKLLAETREVAMQAYAHQDLPFEKLVEELGGQRDLSRTPLFQVAFALQNAPVQSLELAGLRLEPFKVEQTTAKFDLTLDLGESSEGILGSLEYNTDLFDATTIARMASHFETLLEGIVLNPDKPVGELSLLSEGEQRQVLVDWNATATAYPQESTIVALFEAQATRTPDAVAIASDEGQLTYADLNVRANRLAHHLVASGLGAETAVGVFMPRTIDMVVALLGVLKCGAVYVPLDPDYPTRRLAFLARDARIAALLTLERPDAEFVGPGVQVVNLEQARSAIASRSSANPTQRSHPDSLAYVMYTSGSTGTPKGVGVPHRGVIRLLFGVGYAEFGPHVVVPHLSSPTFDASTFEIWAPLLHGGRCVLHTHRVPSPQDLATTIRTHGLTTMWLTSALFNSVVDEDPDLLSGLDQLLIGGEALSPSHVRLAVAALPTTQVINGYGPTESTTFTCCYPIPNAYRAEGRSIPIGRPIGNTQVYVLDGSMQSQPVGVAGDLYVGGAGLARGYFNRPAQTAEVFVPNPFGTAATRLYRTGDRSRWLSTGDVEFLGRRDHQVKIRGFRIETGEIEAVLGQHPGVREVVVLARADTPGEARLVAYLVAHEGLPDAAELRSYLKASLPEYMVPTAFVTLDALPLTSNGKVDRHALPAPQASYTEETYVAPRNDRETRLAAMFADVLGTDRVGVHDDFFEAGGHSLLATKLVSRIRTAFGTAIPLRRVFESPTVSELARSIGEEEARPTPNLDTPPLERTHLEGPLPLSFAQQRLWFLEQMEPGNPYYNMPAALSVSGEVRVAALERAFTEIVRRHEILQAGYVLQHGQPVQVRIPSTQLVVRIVDLSSLDQATREAQVQQLAALDARRPFDLQAGQVLRVTLVTCGESSHTILFAMHHIVSDGWSLAIVVRELSVVYAAFGDGRPSPLDELPVQYADFAVWQRRWLESDGLKPQLAYWKARLQGQLPALDIRTDRPRPEFETFRGADEILLVPKPLTGALNRLSAREHVTLFMTLVAAYKTLLYRHIGEDDVVVGTDLAGRNRAELEELIGFFVNLLVLRTDLSGNPTFRDLLGRVRETVMGAFAHQDVPFDRLVEELRPKRHRSRTPLFQMLFVMENVPVETLRLPGLTMTPMPSQADTARFDLAVFAREQKDGIVTRWTYKTDLFDRVTIQRLANQYLALLDNIAAAPDTRVNELALQTESEIRDQALEEQRRQGVKMSTLVPGRRRARKLVETPGAAETNRAAEGDGAGDATKAGTP